MAEKKLSERVRTVVRKHANLSPEREEALVMGILVEISDVLDVASAALDRVLVITEDLLGTRSVECEVEVNDLDDRIGNDDQEEEGGTQCSR